MTERLEDRLRDALDLLTADPPLAGAAGPPRLQRRPPRPAVTRRLPALVAAAAVIAVGLVWVDRIADRPDDSLRQVTGPVTTTISVQPAPPPPPPTTKRATYPDAPAISDAPVARASVAFGFGTGGRWTWFVADGASGSIRVAADLLPARSFESRGAALSPDGRRLAYSIIVPRDADGPPVTPQVVVVDLTTGRETRFAADAHLRHGAWSPDGRRLAWIEGGHTVVLADADGRPLASVPVGAGRTGVAWSPDGSRLVVAGCPVVDSCPPTFVDAGSLASRDLAVPVSSLVVWSPDGRGIVDPLATGITFFAADGSGGRGLAMESLHPLHPFSPDGQRMAVRPSSPRPGEWYAGVAEVSTGRAVTKLTDSQQVPEVLGWKGNDALLVTREEPGEIVVYAAPLDGSARRRLFSVAIRSEDFGSASLLVAAWFTRA